MGSSSSRHFNKWRKELNQLNRLALYSVATNVCESLFFMIDMSMLGHLGKGNLAAGVVAMTLYNIPWLFLEGFLSAQDTLVSRSSALHDMSSVRHWSYLSLVAVICLAALFTLIFLFSPLLIPYGFMVNNHITAKAVAHVFLLIPAFWCHAVFRVLQKYLQSQLIIFPALACSAFGLVVNALGSYLLLFIVGTGFWGCGVSISVARLCMLAALCRYIYLTEDTAILVVEMRAVLADLRSCDSSLASPQSRSHDAQLATLPAPDGGEEGIEMTASEGGQPGDGQEGETEQEESDSIALLREAETSDLMANRRHARADLTRLVVLGLPGGLMMGLECWSYELCALFVAQMGTVSLDAHQIVVATTSFFYLSFPFAISIAANIRVSKLLAQNKVSAARTVALLALAEGALFMLLSSGAVYLFSNYVGYIFVSDADIVDRVCDLAMYAALFQVAFGVQAGAQGALRATSHQMDVVSFTFVSMWLVGVPLGLYLAFYSFPRMGLEGLWIGLVTGMTLLALALLATVLSLDWELEAKKVALLVHRSSHSHSGSSRISTDGTSSSAVINRGIISLDVSAPVIGSRSVGGFSLLLGSLQEELEMVEMTEIGQRESSLTSPDENEECDEMDDYKREVETV